MAFKIIIAGGRSFENYKLLKFKMNKLLKNVQEEIVIISGKASGADSLGEKYAKEKGFKIKEFPADWENFEEPCIVRVNKYGKEYNALAGPNRNQKMSEYGDAAVIFWDGFSTGTKDMIERATKKGLKLRIIKY